VLGSKAAYRTWRRQNSNVSKDDLQQIAKHDGTLPKPIGVA